MTDPPAIDDLIVAIEGVSTPEEFEHLVANRPELFGPEMEAHLEGAPPDFERLIEVFLSLVRAAHEDPPNAWAKFENRMRSMSAETQQMDSEHEEVEALISKGRFDDAIPRAERLLEHAQQAGLGLAVGRLHELLATAYRERSEGDPGENREISIEHFDAAIRTSIDEAQKAQRMMNLAVAVGSRLRGDPAENLEISVGILREARAFLIEDGPSDVLATIEMNLAHSLEIRERGDRKENLAEAREHCLASLDWRSLQRNPRDWAFSQVNLSAIERARMGIGDATRAEAESPLLAVVEARSHVPRWLAGVAFGSLGSLLKAEASRERDADERYVIGPGKPPPPGKAERELLDRARTNLCSALEFLDDPQHRDHKGVALGDLASVELAVGNETEAIRRYRDALKHLRPSVSPHDCLEAGGSLAARALPDLPVVSIS